MGGEGSHKFDLIDTHLILRNLLPLNILSQAPVLDLIPQSTAESKLD